MGAFAFIAAVVRACIGVCVCRTKSNKHLFVLDTLCMHYAAGNGQECVHDGMKHFTPLCSRGRLCVAGCAGWYDGS